MKKGKLIIRIKSGRSAVLPAKNNKNIEYFNTAMLPQLHSTKYGKYDRTFELKEEIKVNILSIL